MSIDKTQEEIIRELLEKSICYVLYDPGTFIPSSSSGIKYSDIPEGRCQAEISFLDHENFVLGKRKYEDCIIRFDADHRAIILTNTDEIVFSYKILPNTIRDLNPQHYIFNSLGLKFRSEKDLIFIEYDQKEEQHRILKNMRGIYKLHVTEYQNPVMFYETLEFNIEEFYYTKIKEYKLTKDYGKISVWGTR